MSPDRPRPRAFDGARHASSPTDARSITGGMDYLVRAAPPQFPQKCEEFRPSAAGRRLWRVAGIGRDEKFGAAFERIASLPPDSFQLPTVGLLAGLHGYGSPIAFTLSGADGRVSVEIGVWTSQPDLRPGELDDRAGVLAAVLASLYPVVHLEPTEGATVPATAADLVLGVPSVKAPGADDGVVAYDRIIRSLPGEAFQVVVLAQPLADQRVERLRDEAISEMRWVQEAAHAESLPSPLCADYLEMLKKYLQVLATASTIGAWRTAVYLCGDGRSLPRLESVWRSTFSGKESIPDPVRTHRTAAALLWAQRWALPQVPGVAGSTYLSRPFELQTILTSDRLAAYIHLPEQEAPGFAVDAVARFDSVATVQVAAGGDTIGLGTVVHAGRPTSERVEVPVDSLTKHVLVCGVTGSGKSTTIRHVLAELAERDVPFMVIEPAKAEYRALASLPALAGRLRVFTAGDEQVAPLRVNPLAPSSGTSVAMHLDMLKSLFSASFGLWAPLPQILERCLHELYADYGWDLGRNTNRRLEVGADWESGFPTMSELHDKVEAYIDTLGYRGEVTANMRAALVTRISGLTVGGKGRMLDTRRSTPAEELFDRPVVLELERLADEEDQAFLMGLLLVRLAEHRRAQGPSRRLRHLLVVEEAHRLLTRAQSPGTADAANPRAKAVESFANLLAETRSYGQGVLVADQVPVKLATEVIKNSNLKIAHRLVADDDRMALGSAMVMDDRQRRALATLSAGQAAVFAEGQDAPILVQMSAGADLGMLTDPEIAVDDGPSSCRMECRGLDSCQDARVALTANVTELFSRVAQTLMFDAGSATRLWPEIEMAARAAVTRADAADRMLECLVYRAAEVWARTRGAQCSWPFDAMLRIAYALGDAVLSRDSEPEFARAYAREVEAASVRSGDAFPRCGAVCPDGTCRHRHAAASRLTDEVLVTMADIAFHPAESGVDPAQQVWVQAADVAVHAIEFPTPDLPAETWRRLQKAAVAMSLCTAQQALMRQTQPPANARLAVLDRVLAVAPRDDVVPPAETLEGVS